MEETLQSEEFKRIEEEEKQRLLTQQTQLSQVSQGTTSDQNEEEDTLSDIDDKEVEMYLNTEEEVKVKTQLWTDLHKDYLEMMEAKQKELAKRPPPKVSNPFLC